MFIVVFVKLILKGVVIIVCVLTDVKKSVVVVVRKRKPAVLLGFLCI